MNNIELKDIKINNEYIINWEYEEHQRNNLLRFYYKKDEEYLTFNFVMYDVANEEILFHGASYFDGIRHLYFGDEQCDNYGYLYYPNLNDIIFSLTILRRYELQFCNIEAIYGDVDENKNELILLKRDEKLKDLGI